MRDNALLVVVGVLVIGGAVWLLPKLGASLPARSPRVVAQPKVEAVKPGPDAGSGGTPQDQAKPVKSHRSAESTVVVVTVTDPQVHKTPSMVPTPATETAAPETAVPVAAAPAPAAPAPAVRRFPIFEEIRWGTDKPQIKEMFGDPALSAVTTNLGHDLEAYVYSRDRGQAVTVIRFEDGKVIAMTPQRPPFSPTNLQAAAVSPTQVDLTWTNNADDATAVLLELETTGNSARFDLGTTRTLTGTTVTNLQPNRSYTFRVRAQNAVGYSGFSRPATVTLPLPSYQSGR